jgi:uncharacterized protein (TIRG00374 family)
VTVRQPSAPDSPPATKQNVPLLAAKIVVAVALIGLLWSLNILDIGALTALARAPGLAVSAILLFFATIPLSSLRWWLLLRTQSIHLPLLRVFQITAIGQFFNIFMPGGVGGDAMRFYYLFGHAPGKRPAAAMSLLADRLLGMGALLTLASLIIVIDSDLIAASVVLLSFAQGVIALFAIAVACAALVLITPKGVVHRMVDPLLRWGPIGEAVHGCFEAVSVYRRSYAVAGAGIALSLTIQLISIAGCITTAAIFAFPGLTWRDYAFATPLALLANQLPLTPGGIGVGEGVFAIICQTIAGPGPPYATVFLAVRLLSAIAALYGAAAWVNYRKSVAPE